MARRFIDIRESFWFWPGVFAAGGVVLAEAIHSYAHAPGTRIFADVYSGGLSSARDLLATIAGASLTVAATTFSITIASLTLAASQMGPRIMRAFRTDESNKICLGVFLGTFAYCLAMLRLLGNENADLAQVHMGATLGILTASASVVALIWFIHHSVIMLDVTRVLSSLGDSLGPAFLAASRPRATPSLPLLPPTPTEAEAQTNERGGFVRAIQDAALAKELETAKGYARFIARPGDFVPREGVIAEVWPPGCVDVRRYVVFGSSRTPEDDPEFAVRQIVEIALRALSPAINDPFTAITALERLVDGFTVLKDRELNAPRIIGGRVEIPGTDYDGLIDAMFRQIMQAGAEQPAVLIHMLELLIPVRRIVPPENHRDVDTLADDIVEISERRPTTQRDRDDLLERRESLRRAGLQGQPTLLDPPSASRG